MRRGLARAAGDKDEYRKQVRFYHASYPARVSALYEAGRPYPKDPRTDIRVIPYARILAEASRLSMWREEPEEVRLHQVPKSDGGHRTIMSFGRLRKARSIMLVRAERPALKFHEAQYTVPKRGGRNQLVRDLSAALPTHPWVALLDIRKCFDTVPHEAVRTLTASPKAVLDRTVLKKEELNVDVTKTYRKRSWRYTPGEVPDLLSSVRSLSMVDDSHHYMDSFDLGCPQGISASALVVDAVIADVLSTVELGDARLVVYSDNIAVACRTRAEARRMTKTLLAAFAAHPRLSGLMTLRVIHQARRADYGFEHLGYHLKRRCGRTVIAPTKKNALGFARRWQAWRADKRAGTSDRDTRRGLLSWISTFREWDRAELYRAMVSPPVQLVAT